MQSKFSFILIPDTQKMSRNHSDIFLKMTKWITNYALESHVDAVVHLGDVVDQGARAEEEFVSGSTPEEELPFPLEGLLNVRPPPILTVPLLLQWR